MRDAPKSGTVIAEKYRIERVLGAGGMGVVVAAEHLLLGQRVALKFVIDTTDQESVERFMREARAAASLQTAHVCRVMDVGRDDGLPYIVMELLQGADLAKHLLAYGPMTVEQAVDVVLQVLDGLGEAHQNGIVHRDLKPGNLFLAKRSDGTSIVKILDFGISKLQRSRHGRSDKTAKTGASSDDDAPPSVPTLTGTGVTMGSPPYMSPEQVRSTRDVDARSDIWAIGTILYELVTGRRTFPGNVPRIADILAGHYTPLRELRPELPPELERIVGRCLRVAPDERYPDVEHLADDLAALAPSTPFASAHRAKRIATSPTDRQSAAFGPEIPSSATSAATATVVALTPPRMDAPATRAPLFVGLAIGATIATVATLLAVRREPVRTANPPPPASTVVVATPAEAATPSASAIILTSTSATSMSPAPPASRVRPPRSRPNTAPKASPSAEPVDLGRL